MPAAQFDTFLAALAATANVHGATLLTRNLKDLALIADLVDAQDLQPG